MQLIAVRCVFAIGFGCAAASPALAQFGVAKLSHANGGVTRQHAGAPAATTIDVSLMDGDQLATTDGRAEITFYDGAVVHLDRNTRVVLNANERLQLLAGRAFVSTSGVKPVIAEWPSGKFRVMPAAVVELTLRAENRDVVLRVISGWASLESQPGNERVTAYHTATVSASNSRAVVSKWVPAQTDEFERWTLSRTVMASSRETGAGAPAYYGNYFGGWHYSSPSYVYYPGYMAVYPAPYYATPYYSYPTYYSAPSYVAPSYSTPYYSRPYGSTFSYPASREPVYQWYTFEPLVSVRCAADDGGTITVGTRRNLRRTRP